MNIILELDCNEKFKKIINEINNLQKYPNVLSKPNKIFETYSTLKNNIPFNYITSYNPDISNSLSSYYKSNLDNLYKLIQEFFNNLNSIYSSIIDMYIIYDILLIIIETLISFIMSEQVSVINIKSSFSDHFNENNEFKFSIFNLLFIILACFSKNDKSSYNFGYGNVSYIYHDLSGNSLPFEKVITKKQYNCIINIERLE